MDRHMVAQSSQQDDIPVVGQWSLTQTKKVKCNHTWTIDNFNCEEAVDVIKSPIFSVEANDKDKIKWRLILYPKGRSKNSEFVSVYIKLVSCDKSVLIGSCILSILNSLPKEVKYVETKTLQTKNFQQNMECGISNFIRRHYLLKQSNRLLNENKLTICCELTFNVDTVDISGQRDLVQMLNPRECLSNDMDKLFEDKRRSDVTLVAGGIEIQAHKVILMARSAVFKAMFEHDMQEQELSRVDIIDVDHDTLTAMLRFIYTDRVPNINEVAADLLVAADKYALDNLKVMCEEALCRDLSVETAADTLIWAELHSAALLKEQTVAFINSRHVEMVMQTEGWKKMISTHPHLVAELFRKVTVQLQKHLPIYSYYNK